MRIINSKLTRPEVKDLCERIITPGKILVFSKNSGKMRFAISLLSQWDYSQKFKKQRVLVYRKEKQDYCLASNKSYICEQSLLTENNDMILIEDPSIVPMEIGIALLESYHHYYNDYKLRKKYIDG